MPQQTPSENFRIRSNGKLLLSAEYLVLDGAMALALPTRLGQSLYAKVISEPAIYWKSMDNHGKIWFETSFKIDTILHKKTTKTTALSKRLAQILMAASILNPLFLKAEHGYEVICQLEFPRDWGLGSSSTLINNIAQWAEVDPYKLLEKTFGGSGYDIACAQHKQPLCYQLTQKTPKVTLVNFEPAFKQQLFFVHLNQKQNSRKGIAHYRNHISDLNHAIPLVNEITQQMIRCKTLENFQSLLKAHESLIGKISHQTPVQQQYFADFSGTIKSLGAWGGDFILVASECNPKAYFNQKGFHTICSYVQLIG